MPDRAKKIRLIISDVDGVWTDGGILYSDERESKRFHVRDGLAVKIAQRAGIPVAVITSRSSKALERRCRELGIDHLVQGAGNKLVEVNGLARRYGVNLDEILYVGDDLPDLPPMRRVGISAAPADAAAEVADAATWRLETRGGHGSFREVVERLLKERGEWEKVLEGFDEAQITAPGI